MIRYDLASIMPIVTDNRAQLVQNSVGLTKLIVKDAFKLLQPKIQESVLFAKKCDNLLLFSAQHSR